MAKQRHQGTRSRQVTRLLFWATLVLSVGVSLLGAGQQGPPNHPPDSQLAAHTGQKTATAPPARSARPLAQRKSSMTNASGSSLASGRRDPFQLPGASTGKAGAAGVLESVPSGVLPGGERGLIISQLRLEGVVRENTQNVMIAVVTNETKRAYFLRENQSVYNGIVSKITPDAVYFKENVLDTNGRVTTREVVKRLGAAPGEGR